jgi:hypothetical protein
MLFAFAAIKWIVPIKTTRITASMIAYSATPWPCSDRSLFKLKRPKLLASSNLWVQCLHFLYIARNGPIVEREGHQHWSYYRNQSG